MTVRIVAAGCVAALLVWAATSPPALAKGDDGAIDEIRKLAAAGRFTDAAAAGEADGSAHALALAAQALGDEARCRYRGDGEQRARLFARVEDLARRATELDPTDALAWRQLSRARGRLLELRQTSVSHDEAVAALRDIVDALDQAKAHDPDGPEVELALGVVEVSKLVVSRDAMFGLFSVMGDREAALQHFCRAARLADVSNDPVSRVVVHAAIGRSLWRLDADVYRASAIRHLDQALAACDDGHAVCACIHREASELRQSIAFAAPVTGTPPQDAENCPR